MTLQPRILAHLRKFDKKLKVSKPDDGPRSDLQADNIPYFLQVAAQIPRSALPSFHNRSRELIAIIEDAGLKLELSCWSVVGDVVNYYNYWSLGSDANRLFKAELILPDNPAYLKYAELWTTERKDLVISINSKRRDPDQEALAKSSFVYLRVTYNIKFAALSEFDARIESSLMPFAVMNGWYLGDCYYGLTGLAGDIVQMWIVPESSAAFAAQRLSTAPWHALIEAPPTYQILEPTPTDPALGAHRWPVRRTL